MKKSASMMPNLLVFYVATMESSPHNELKIAANTQIVLAYHRRVDLQPWASQSLLTKEDGGRHARTKLLVTTVWFVSIFCHHLEELTVVGMCPSPKENNWQVASPPP